MAVLFRSRTDDGSENIYAAYMLPLQKPFLILYRTNMNNNRFMDDSFEGFLNWLQSWHIYPTLADMDFLKQHTAHTCIRKNTIIMKQERAVTEFYYINSGIARLFLKHKDEDITIAFINAPQFASTIHYLLNGLPSPLAIETCTDIKALQWTKADIIAVKEYTSFGNKMEQAFTETLLNWNFEREMSRLIHSPEERYRMLLKTAPLVPLQVPLKYIASYLGIHQDSLSRIRNRLLRKT